jgi:CIC family chloride channel protein
LTTAVMIAVVLASVTASRLFPYSWFSLQLMRRGVDMHAGREVRIMRARQVGDLVTAAPGVIAPTASTWQARELLLALQSGEALVVDWRGVLRGQVLLTEVVQACDAGHGTRPVAALAAMPGIVLRRGDTLDSAMRQLRYFMGHSVPVVDSAQTMRLAGVVFQSSVIGAYNDAVAQARAELN